MREDLAGGLPVESIRERCRERKERHTPVFRPRDVCALPTRGTAAALNAIDGQRRPPSSALVPTSAATDITIPIPASIPPRLLSPDAAAAHRADPGVRPHRARVVAAALESGAYGNRNADPLDEAGPVSGAATPRCAPGTSPPSPDRLYAAHDLDLRAHLRRILLRHRPTTPTPTAEAKLVRKLGENVPPELIFPALRLTARRRASTLSVPESKLERQHGADKKTPGSPHPVRRRAVLLPIYSAVRPRESLLVRHVLLQCALAFAHDERVHGFVAAVQ
ncbi:hypothetical protein B0H13DRAFT_2301002 [Mycena leptocephala]|nr:hypothetical protein B0H13DRAFT_2301002 [Mycena leptocephala]